MKEGMMKEGISPRKFEVYKKWKQRQQDKIVNSLKVKMFDMQEEIERLKEYEFMYKQLSK